MNIRDIFPEKIVVSNEPSRFVPNTPCWIWTGTRTQNGYGRVYYQGKIWVTSRLSLYLKSREFDPALLACHTCDNPPCCNPDHIFAGTQSDNICDRIKWSGTLTTDEISEIRQSKLPEAVLARRYKITANQVKMIRPRGYRPERYMPPLVVG